MTDLAALLDAPSYGLDHLPYGAVLDEGGRQFTVVRIGDQALDLGALTAGGPYADVLATENLDALLAAGRPAWSAVRAMLTARLGEPSGRAELERQLLPLSTLTPILPFSVADYVDFYASEHHAVNVGRLFRPDQAPLPPNWKHLPIGYHGRAGTVVVSGTEVSRPRGQLRDPSGDIRVGSTDRLDFEAEVGFVLGGRTSRGEPVPIERAAEHLFGICLVNDWSARDIQAWESVPLGPFLGKSFATSVSAWITPIAALDSAWIDPPVQDPRPSSYLASAADRGGLDLLLQVAVNGAVISSPPFATMYWTPAQLLAHMTVNGASVRPGDLFASGTVSGPRRDQCGSLLELTVNGSEPLSLPDGRSLGFLQDGDEVVISGSVPSASGHRIELGECRGRVVAGTIDCR